MLFDLVGSAPDAETGVIVAMWLAAVVFLFGGYGIGGNAWRSKFAVRLEGWAVGRTMSGFWIELVVITYTAILVFVINKLTPDAGFLNLFIWRWHWVAGIVLLTVVLVFLHSRRVIRHLPVAEAKSYPGYVDDLARGYLLYNFFSVIIFSFYLITCVLVVQQFIADQGDFAVKRQVLQASLDELSSAASAVGPSAVQAKIEKVNSHLLNSVQTIIEQINTVFLIFFFVLAINFLIEFTPVRAAYTQEGVSATHSGVLLVLAIVLLIGWYLYYTEYLGVMREAIARVALVEDRVRSDNWEIAKRYYEVLNDLRGRQGITGFAITLSNERGGLLLLLGALQFMFGARSRYSRRAAQEGP